MNAPVATHMHQRELLLASMRLAILNLRGWQSELEMIGTALSRDMMTMDTACDWLDEAGLLHWLPPAKQIEANKDQELA